MNFFSFFFLLIMAVPALGQTNAQIETELVSSIKEVQKYSAYSGNSDDEKLNKANDAFEKKLVRYIKNASTLTYEFTKLKEFLFIATSDDGKLRIYSWDTEGGGTMHDYSRVYQYQGTDGKIYSRARPEPQPEEGGGSFVYDIFTVDAKSKKVYIVCSTGIASTTDYYQSADLYRIEGARLRDRIRLIKTASGITNSLGFEYDFFSVVKREERPVKLIRYNSNTQTLSIPVVVKDDDFGNGKVTDGIINYRFNGTYFVKIR